MSGAKCFLIKTKNASNYSYKNKYKSKSINYKKQNKSFKRLRCGNCHCQHDNATTIAQPINLSTESTDEMRATLSRRRKPATEKVIIVIFWQIQKPRCEAKSVVKPKFAGDRALTQLFLALSRDCKDKSSPIQMSWSAWAWRQKWITDGIATWDLTRKFGQWFLWQQRLWSSSWRWQRQALEPLSTSATAARKP